MAQVFVLGQVGRCIIEAKTYGSIVPEADTDSALQTVGVTVLSASVI